MKYLLSILVLTLSLSACKQGEKKDNLSNNSSENNFNFRETSSRFQSIALLNEGDFRGLNIGDPMGSVRDLEDMLVLNDDFYRHYQVDLNEFEFFDLLYYNYDGKLDEIQVDVHMSEDAIAYEVYTNFEDFFISKYGEPTIDFNGFLNWNEAREDSSIVGYNLKYVSTYPEDGEAILETKIKIGVQLVK